MIVPQLSGHSTARPSPDNCSNLVFSVRLSPSTRERILSCYLRSIGYAGNQPPIPARLSTPQGDVSMSRCLCAFLLGLLCVWPAHADTPAVKVRQKLYVTNSAGDDITVIDVATNKPIGRIEVGPNPHGIAVPAAQNVILVTIEGRKPGELVWIDPRTDKITRRM